MSSYRLSARAPLVAALGLLAYTTSAYAYLDPGTGSIIIQGAIAAIAGGAVAARMYWHRIKTFFDSRRKRNANSADPAAGPEAHHK